MNARTHIRSLALAIAVAAAVLALADGRPEPATVSLVSGGLTADLQARHAWNLQRISWEGVEVCTPTGAYGTLLCVPAAGGWIGGAHTEGGVEEIENATLSVDGEVADLTDGAVYPGERIELTKLSMLDLVQLDAQLILEDGRLTQRCGITATEDVVVSVVYPFMFCVSAQATQWLAVTGDGEELSGEFTGESGLEWHEGWQWTAAFIPEQRTGFLMRHVTAPEGARMLTGWWDTQRYRKLYVKLETEEDPWPEGLSLAAEVVVVCFQAPPATWQDAARAVAAGLVVE